ncbi:MAG TPA: hypothetical protein VGJ42_03175 [Nitrososphaera sp.]
MKVQRIYLMNLLRKLSEIDKKILKVLLDPNGRVSSHTLSTKLPRTTIQHRRFFLEKHYLEFVYILKLDYLGYRRIDLLLYTGGGDTIRIAQKLLRREEIVYVCRTIGEHTMDLRATAIVKNTLKLLDLLEALKSIPNVRDVVWSELVQVLGRKRSVPSSVIDDM